MKSQDLHEVYIIFYTILFFHSKLQPKRLLIVCDFHRNSFPSLPAASFPDPLNLTGTTSLSPTGEFCKCLLLAELFKEMKTMLKS